MKALIQILFHFLLWGLVLLISGSCSKRLAEISPAKASDVTANLNSYAQPVPIPVDRCLVIDTLQSPLNIPGFIVDPYYSQRVQTKTKQFYLANSFGTQWLFDHTPNSLYYVMIESLKNAFHYGLVPDDYDVTGIEENVSRVYAQGSSTINDVVNLDIHITKMYFLFTTHLQEGKVRSVGNADHVWKRPARDYSLIDVPMLLEMRDASQFPENINKLQPANEQYVRLQHALDQYRFLEKAIPKVFTDIPANGAGGIKPEESSLAIPFIRRRLSLTDLTVLPALVDSTSGFRDSLRYDDALLSSVKIFQRIHGLEPDGIIGEKTVKYLNQSFREKADVIALNMERMKWIPEGYSENYVVVNIPEFKLRVYEDYKLVMEMKVIVGASNNATPVFSDEMEYIVFSPTWTVPTSIIREEIIPRLKDNPEYYLKRNYSFFRNDVEIDPASVSWNDDINPYQFRVVQNPGAQNSLGLVKFVMPNSMSVYLHDTPNHRLFSKDFRALSHGCVRLDEPAIFAAYLLRDQRGWTEERISKAMHSEQPVTVLLKKHFDVHLEYRTAWVDDAGVVNFREDLYGHDKLQLMQLITSAKPLLVL